MRSAGSSMTRRSCRQKKPRSFFDGGLYEPEKTPSVASRVRPPPPSAEMCGTGGGERATLQTRAVEKETLLPVGNVSKAGSSDGDGVKDTLQNNGGGISIGQVVVSSTPGNKEVDSDVNVQPEFDLMKEQNQKFMATQVGSQLMTTLDDTVKNDQVFEDVTAVVKESLLNMPGIKDFVLSTLPALTPVSVLLLSSKVIAINGNWTMVSQAGSELVQWIGTKEKTVDVSSTKSREINMVTVNPGHQSLEAAEDMSMLGELTTFPNNQSAARDHIIQDRSPATSVSHTKAESDGRLSVTCVENSGGTEDVGPAFQDLEIPVRDMCQTLERTVEVTSALLPEKKPTDPRTLFKCNKCEKKFANASSLSVHHARCHEEKLHRCDTCGKMFAISSELRRHIRAVHEGKYVCKCDLCGKLFNEKRYLSIHMRRHTGVKNHQCPICGWKFFEGHKLKWHMETHKVKGEKQLPYRCDTCNKSFYNKASLMDHQNTHTGDRPFVCSQCQAKFAHRVGLRRHMLVHTDNKPFICEYCKKGFKLKQKLDAHLIQHTKQSKHKCNYCGKIFTVSTSLKRHKCKPNQDVLKSECAANATSVVFMCGICQTTFPSLQEAEIHAVNHVAK